MPLEVFGVERRLVHRLYSQTTSNAITSIISKSSGGRRSSLGKKEDLLRKDLTFYHATLHLQHGKISQGLPGGRTRTRNRYMYNCLGFGISAYWYRKRRIALPTAGARSIAPDSNYGASRAWSSTIYDESLGLYGEWSDKKMSVRWVAVYSKCFRTSHTRIELVKR